MDADIRASANQAPPLVDHNTVTSDAALVDAVTRHASARRGRRPRGARRGGELGGGPRARDARERPRARAGALRPLRQPRRRGPVPPVVALADGARGRLRPAGRAVDLRRPARPRAARGRLLRLVPDRAGPRLPDLHDVRRGAGVAGRRRDRQGVDAPARVHVLRLRPASRRGQGRRAGRHGDDREAGRLRRPRQRDDRDADVGRRGVHPRRAQVVHLRADERRVPGAGPGRRRAQLLPGAARPRRRQPQPPGRRTPQGQAGQPVERVLRARAPRHLGAAARRRGPGRPDDHRDGRRHPAGLRARLGVADAPRPGRGVLARRAPLGVRRPARRQAADAERHRRPGRRVRGRHRARHAAGRGGRRRRTTRTRRRCAGSRCRWRSTGSASAPR